MQYPEELKLSVRISRYDFDMNTFNAATKNIITRVQLSPLSEEEKAGIYAELSLGLHKLVWTILIAHIPEEKLKEVTSQTKMTIDQYADCIDLALKNPETSKELHDMTMESLQEIDALLTKKGIPQKIAL